MTNPSKKGNPATCPGTLFQTEYYEHMPEPYDRAKEMRAQEIKEHHKKMIDEKSWKPMVHGGECFEPIETAYGTELEFKEKKPKPKPKPQVEHDKPFMPSNPVKKGKTGMETLSLFPEHVPEKQFQQKKKKIVTEEEEANAKPGWKPTHRNKSKPSPSVYT